MKKHINFSLIILIIVFSSSVSNKNGSSSKKLSNSQDTFNEIVIIKMDAETAKINPRSAEIVEDNRFTNNKGVTLKPGVASSTDRERADADLVFNVKVPKAGRYVMITYAVTDTEGAELMKKATSKFESLYIKIQIDNRRPTKRVVYVPWDRPRQESGKFEFSGKDQQLKIWLPRGVRLEYVQLSNYVPPSVPECSQELPAKNSPSQQPATPLG